MGEPKQESTKTGKRAKYKVILVLLLVVVVGLMVASIWLPVKDYAVEGLDWVRSKAVLIWEAVKAFVISVLTWAENLGFWAPFIVAAFYVVACVFLLPGGIITIAAGFLFGVVTGTITVSVGSTLGASAAFLIGRSRARDWVRKKVSGHPKFEAIDRAVGEQGFKIVLLTRLSPIFPFNLQNYAYGLTGVKLWKYTLASWIGMLPGTVAYVYIGSGLESLTEAATGQTQDDIVGRVFFWGGLVATIVVMVVVTRIAQKAMKKAMGEDSAEVKESRN